MTGKLTLDTPGATSLSTGNETTLQTAFVKMLPKIRAHATYRFRHLSPPEREECVQETVANACAAFARLSERGRAGAATWSSLANFAIRQVRAGRKVGSSLNKKDASSLYCQRQFGVRMESLSRWDKAQAEWQELVVEDRHLGPADVAAFRLDFREFLQSLSRRNRRVALLLAKGHSTQLVARRFHLSAGRISQLRRELCETWQKLQAEPAWG